jgi:hypothetical protein
MYYEREREKKEKEKIKTKLIIKKKFFFKRDQTKESTITKQVHSRPHNIKLKQGLPNDAADARAMNLKI